MTNLKPQYHFTQVGFHIIGIEGLIYLEGAYRLFYRAIPEAEPAKVHLFQAKSKDLLHWQDPIECLPPEKWAQAISPAWIMIDQDNMSELGTGETPPLLMLFSDTNHQVFLRYSLDQGASWQSPNDEKMTNVTGQSPTLLWYQWAGQWLLMVVDEEHGEVVGKLYTSGDFKNWTNIHTFPGDWSGSALFEIEDQTDEFHHAWVLWNKGGHYVIGHLHSQKKVRLSAWDNDKRIQPLTGEVEFCQGWGPGRLCRVPGRRQVTLMSWIDNPDSHRGQLGIPCLVALQNKTELVVTPIEKLNDQRFWKRTWAVNGTDGNPFRGELEFGFGSGAKLQDRYQGVGFMPAKGTEDDISAEAYVVDLSLDVRSANRVEIEILGQTLRFTPEMQMMNIGERAFNLTTEKKRLNCRLFIDQETIELFNDDGTVVATIISKPLKKEITIEYFLKVKTTSEAMGQVTVYGMRRTWRDATEAKYVASTEGKSGRIFYQSDYYTIYANRIEDRSYGLPHAWVPDKNTIVSPTRIVETFDRSADKTFYGRVVDRETIWQPKSDISSFPQLETGYDSVDIAYRVAADIFKRISSDEFSNSFQGINNPGMWAAGFMQGSGASFGVWVRDSAHIGLRAGNLIDPTIARRTLLYTTQNGLDNGIDGPIMPMVGIWDYYLSTGDSSLIREVWDTLKESIATVEAVFMPDLGLVPADHSTSNDYFRVPEDGGFSLGSEAYFMQAYLAMANMGQIIGEAEGLVARWQNRGQFMILLANSFSGMF